jgi:hypothetical protein
MSDQNWLETSAFFSNITIVGTRKLGSRDSSEVDTADLGVFG